MKTAVTRISLLLLAAQPAVVAPPAAAIRSIEELTAAGKPWMVASGFHSPYDPFHAPRQYFDLYPKDSLPPWPAKAGQ